ncbi:hypothetical protein [Micromonospora sp. HM5-17]|uniref:hypothetical protein n=1 Tax=Micromonospora sp. HM5-17 TaxID=2487710 RepID=UPI001F3866AD|nr:hypothetical protein [Micromonospora sp. HM5-17]
MRTMTSEAEELLAAGAILPLETDGAAEHAVPLTARTYRHPVLDDRPVVRLVAAELGAAEDATAGFLGLTRVDEPVPVGLGQRQVLGFPEWVLVHHPEDGRHALAVLPELRRIAEQARSKARLAVEAYHALAGRLARSVPHFLPTFYEQAGRVFLALEEQAYAGQMFTRARRAEAEHGLPVDPDRLDAVYLEFALAGALSAATLAGYAKDLAARLPAAEALDRFCRLGVRSVAAGLVPSAQTATAVRRLVRAAKKAGDPAGAEARERAYLAELIRLPATTNAMAWWRAHLPELVGLAAADRTVRGVLLDLMPRDDHDGTVLPQWLEVLTRTGAVEGLVDGTLPAAERPADGSVGWLRRLLDSRHRGRRRPPRLPELYALVSRMADQLRRELAETGDTIEFVPDLDLVDLLLSLGLPVDDPGDRPLHLDVWASGDGQRDLSGIAADPRYRAALRRTIADPRDAGDSVIRLLARLAGGRTVLAEQVRAWARECDTAALPGLYDATERLAALPREALALAPDEVSAASRTDLAETVARTLRGGIVAELGWPAWEEALAEVVGADPYKRRIVADAWPYLVVAGPTRARVIDADGIVLRHDLRIPPGDSPWRPPSFHYVDGTLLVCWSSLAHDYTVVGYWHSSAGEPQPIAGRTSRDGGTPTLPLAGGGRTTGAGVLHVGDTVVPKERRIISDGRSYWVYRQGDQGLGWYEYDPTGGDYGRRGLPAFLAKALAGAPAGSTLDEPASWVLPAPTDRVTPLGVPVGGLLGWRVVRLPDGSARGEDLAGRTVTVADGRTPVGALTLPGDDRPRAVLDDGSLVGPDGLVTAVLGPDGREYDPVAVPLPPRPYWTQLRARDPEGSAALRRIDRETVAALLKAALAQQATHRARAANGVQTDADRTAELAALVRAAIPQLGHDALVAGVVGVLRFAVDRQAVLDRLAERLRREPAATPPEEPISGPTDAGLLSALDGLGGMRRLSASDPQATLRQLRLLSRAVAAPAPDPRPRLHLDGPELPWSEMITPERLAQPAAIAYRAVAAPTPEPARAALRVLLARLDGLGLATAGEPPRWRWFTLHLDDSHLTLPDGTRRFGHRRGILLLGGGAFIAVYDCQPATPSGSTFFALYHDPTGTFAIPAPYVARSSEPLGAERPAGWLASFLAEWDARGPLPWRAEAAERFSDLTGVTPTTAKLVLAGMPHVDTGTALPADTRTLLGVKSIEVAYAHRQLGRVKDEVRRAILAALLPAEPARLWTDGPDVAAAAKVWNAAVGRRPAVPEQLLADAVKEVRVGWGPDMALPALLDPDGTPELSTDLVWTVRGDRVAPVDGSGRGFDAETLVGVIATAAWVAHHTPAGDPVRAALPAGLAALRDRLANPELLLGLGRYVSLSAFRRIAGAPTEIGDGWERYGAVVLATHDHQPDPGIRVALLDETGSDPFLPALRDESQQMYPVEVALRLARDPGFAALLADPGDPVAGERDRDGTWWPQDPGRSVPELVAEVAAVHGLGADAAALYLMLLAMPDPTDRNVARWTGWKPARLKAARAELASTELVVSATRSRAGRSLFLPGAWQEHPAPRLPSEQWKTPLFTIPGQPVPPFSTDLPLEPVPDLYRRAWQRIRDGDVPRLEELRTPTRGRR